MNKSGRDLINISFQISKRKWRRLAKQHQKYFITQLCIPDDVLDAQHEINSRPPRGRYRRTYNGFAMFYTSPHLGQTAAKAVVQRMSRSQGIRGAFDEEVVSSGRDGAGHPSLEDVNEEFARRVN
ncbi:Hypothetical_protein [Hexamita inflata]|nr:Hypothetical protein HINF_LOCUS41301 [Hexamita inflata]CAI9953657.1 Hypothetical protein HINF_LOCUS41302 [Hexamita inflata]CAI9953660.1 Hypothetical protein HINF_LOCUS41305 [Hexamita inflata]